jgi:uncharacterized protein YtpQ (UPF0354 family)
MLRYWRLLLCLVVLGPAAGADLLAPRAFTEEFARAVRAVKSSSTVTVKADLELEMTDPDGVQRTVILRNAYKDYSIDPQRFGEIVRTTVAAMSPPGGEPARFDRSRIVPVVKDWQWLQDQHTGFKARGIAQEHLAEPFNKELVIVYAVDDPTRMRYILSGENIGVGRGELRALALENLKRILPKVEMRGDGEVYVMSAGGDYDASLLLIDDIWSGGQVKVNGEIVVALPARDVLVVTGSRSRAGLKRVREFAAKYAAQGPYALSDTLFVYRNGQFTKFGRR